jgi:hypothetical protein
LQKDLQVKLHWENVWGIVQLVFLPNGRVMTVQKTGELRVYDGINKKANVGIRMACVSTIWDGSCPASTHPCLPAASLGPFQTA